MYDIAALGELLIDFSAVSSDSAGYPTLSAHPGGAPANYLAAAAKNGMKTAMIGKVGDDSFGELLIKTLNEAGVDTKGLIRSQDFFTTLAFVTFDENGDREFSFARKPGADTQLGFDEIDFSIIDEAAVFHFGTLSLTDEPSRTATVKAVEYAAKAGKIISFDPNLRKPLWNELAEAERWMLWGLSHADIVKLSDEEVDFLWGISPENGLDRIFSEFGAKLVFVTCGKNGCLFRNINARGNVPGLDGINVVDTTGAGDIFGGSAASMILKTGKHPEKLTESELYDIVTYACRFAGLSTTRPGGISSIPDTSDVEKLK